MSPAVPDVLVRDMAITPADFFRLLPRALDGQPYVATADTVTLGDDGHGVAIAIRVLEPRRIALLVIERCAVTMTFKGCSPAERQGFLERFDRAFHRGGG